MLLLALLSLVAGLANARPQNGCATVTTQVIQPTGTATYTTTGVVTVNATGAKDLGTFTLVETITTTTTLQTLTSTLTACGNSGTVTAPYSTVTVYQKLNGKRDQDLSPRACTVTITTTTTYGETYTFVPAPVTRTHTAYTAYTQLTVTQTKTGGRDYAIGTAFATSMTTCGSATVTPTTLTKTVTRYPKCSPSAITSEYYGYGIKYLSDTPGGGATYLTNATDASACCQTCATSWQCAASAWDIRTSECRLEFPVEFFSGGLNCGEGLLAFYGAGPSMPMAPGTGWYIGQLCGDVDFSNAQPDNGT